MAKQAGIFPILGTLENVTFYKTAEEGFVIRKKGGVSKSRMMTDPAYVRTRENQNQFGLNATAGKTVRDAIPVLLNKAKDSRVSSRLSKIMGEIAQQDPTSIRGQKKISIGLAQPQAAALLKGFNFNKNAVLETILSAAYTVDNATGVVVIDDLIPQQDISKPAGATHVCFRSGFSDIDFDTAITQASYSPKMILPLDLSLTTVVLTPTTVPSSSQNSLKLISLLLEFFQLDNGILYPMSNGSFNTLSIIDARV